MQSRDNEITEEQRLDGVSNSNESFKRDKERMLSFRQRTSIKVDVNLLPESLRHLVKDPELNGTHKEFEIHYDEMKPKTCDCGGIHTTTNHHYDWCRTKELI
ncbi:hypothetical protein KAR91_52325 [Candidatus Pacearchaeota archaeon]|nr:hypothetical protein [Candidatus Pacearchaeota archaeon]